MIRSNTRIVFDVHGAVNGWVPFGAPAVEDVRSRAIAGLSPFFRVHSVSVTDNGLFDATYTARADLVVLGDYDSIDDVKSIVRSAFWEASGDVPTVSAPGYGDPGQPSGGAQSWFKDLTSTAKLIALAGIVLGIVLLRK